jgi:hypothetical protein
MQLESDMSRSSLVCSIWFKQKQPNLVCTSIFLNAKSGLDQSENIVGTSAQAWAPPLSSNRLLCESLCPKSIHPATHFSVRQPLRLPTCFAAPFCWTHHRNFSLQVPPAPSPSTQSTSSQIQVHGMCRIFGYPRDPPFVLHSGNCQA